MDRRPRRGLAALALALSLLVLDAAPARAGGWTRPEGSTYLKVWTRSLVGRRVYVDGRDFVTLPATYQDHQLSAYAELGLREDLSLVGGAVPFGFVAYDGASEPYFGGAWGGVRQRLFATSAAVAAAEVHAGWRPSTTLAEGRIDGRRFLVRPQVGALWIDGELQLGVPLGFGWLAVSGGGRAFTSDALRPAFKASAQLGWVVGERLNLDLHLTFWHSVGPLGDIDALGAGQTRYLGFGLGASYRVGERLAIVGGFDGVAYAYRNAATPSIQLGVELR